MASRGFTNKACPNCHKICDGKNGNPEQRPIDGLCIKCRILIKYGEDYLREKEETKKQSETVVVAMPSSKYIGHINSKSHYSFTEFEEMGRLFYELAMILSEEVPVKYDENYWRTKNPYKNGYICYYDFKIFDRDNINRFFKNRIIPELLNKLKNEVDRVLTEIEQSGINYGKNLLLQLNSGDLTLKEINENM